jgi:hypothetical protein
MCGQRIRKAIGSEHVMLATISQRYNSPGLFWGESGLGRRYVGAQRRRVRCGVCSLSISVKAAKGISSDQLL